MAFSQYPTLSKLSLGALSFNSAIGIHSSWGDAAAVTSVLAVDSALVLLFLCLCEFEQGGGRGRGRDAKTKAAVWALMTLLTAMLASGVAATIMPLAVGALVLLCLRDDRAGEEEEEGGGGGGRVDMETHYCVLAKVGFAVLTYNTAIDAYDSRRDSDSAALVLVSHTLVGILTVLYVRAFSRGRDTEQGQEIPVRV